MVRTKNATPDAEFRAATSFAADESGSRKRRPGKEPEIQNVGVVKRTKSRHDINVLGEEKKVGVANITTVIAHRDNYENLKNRTSPQTLSEAVEAMNEIQKQQVVELGFGQLLNMKIKDVPPKMAYWVLDNFNRHRCEIKIDEHRWVRATEHDVQMMLGLPRGDRRIHRKDRNQESKLTDEWRKCFNKKPDRILPSDVCDYMLSLHEGGVWFK